MLGRWEACGYGPSGVFVFFILRLFVFVHVFVKIMDAHETEQYHDESWERCSASFKLNTRKKLLKFWLSVKKQQCFTEW